MRAHQLKNTIETNVRGYEEIYRDIDRKLSGAREQDLRIEYEILSGVRQIAEIQMDGNDSAEFLRQMKLREEEERFLREKLNQAETSIAGATTKVSALLDKISSEKDAVFGDLTKKPKYVELLDQNKQLGIQRDKTSGAYLEIKAECETKLAGFKENELYWYLRKASYGTNDYDRNGLVRALDGWIAKLCNFNSNLASEQMLVAMRAANETANAGAKEARAQIRGALQKMEAEAISSSKVSALQAQCDKLQREISGHKKTANEYHEALGLYSKKKDARYLNLQKDFVNRLSSMSINELVAQAKESPTKSDDKIVAKLIELEKSRIQLQQDIVDLVHRRNAAQADYERAKDFERNVRSSTSSSDRYEYNSNLDIGSLLTGFVLGNITESSAMSEISRSRREIANEPIASSSSYSSSSSDDSWRSSSSSSSSFSSSSSSGGDSFSTSDGF